MFAETAFLYSSSDTWRPRVFFRNMLSSFSDAWLEQARRYVEAITERLGLGPESRVIKIGSDEGYLLRFFVKRGIPYLA
jgi:hypothetical protein